VDRHAHALAVALRLAVVGAGWAGLAAAVRATEAGAQVMLFEMASQAGGRAREVLHEGVPLDNGQHILIGAYRQTLALMRTVGADPERLLERRPLELVDPHGRGLALPAGAPVPAFVRAVFALRDWPLRERVALLTAAARWRLADFDAPAQQTVAELVRGLPLRARASLIEPLCVAALNTPAEQASARVFLRVLRDALFGGRGGADLLLPRVSLGALVPKPALRWLERHGAALHLSRRVDHLERHGAGWRVDGEPFDAVLLACSAGEAARLSRDVAPAWSNAASAIEYEPIVTVYLRSVGTRWPRPMVALRADARQPAQFAFDLGVLDAGSRDGVFAFVVSGARNWVEQGLETTARATLEQALSAFDGQWSQPPSVLRTLAEKRATFVCRPGMQRPAVVVAPGLAAAGDFVEGPYPATLEGAVRSAAEAMRALGLAVG
jgi:squalene-associated FAD-dependent desaturase